MCDLFWLSAAGEQGDLSDVVRASLQPPHHHLPITPSYLQPGEGGLQQVASHRDDQLGMTISSNHHVLLHSPSTTTYPQPQPLLAAAGMIGQMSMPPAPQQLGLGVADIDKEGDVVAGGDHLQQMALMVHHPHHVPAINKRRKSQTKKVVCIPAPTAASGRASTSGEVVPSDLWAWRKYGQKPIKGSPYPRGYYRCSTSKGCPARKQVERSRTDPNMLVITYTSDHNHPWPTQRNALAGSTRPSTAKNTSSFVAAAAHSSNTNDDSGATAHQQLKQEADLDLFADMDALNIFSSNTKIQLEDDSKQQLFDDPFISTTFFDFGEADK